MQHGRMELSLAGLPSPINIRPKVRLTDGEKTRMWIENGPQLAWLIGPYG
jgi:hypothetical protein